MALFCLSLVLLSSCDSAPEQKTGGKSGEAKKEILVYCGITMTQPVKELAALVEKEKDCIVKVSYGETEWLKNTALATKSGDIFFPGSPSYLQSMQKDGTVTETAQVGENRIVLMVQKGNPKQVQPDLKELLRKDLQIVLGAAGAGSIGKETQHNLDKLGIYRQAVEKAIYLAADSKGLSKAIRSKDADVVVNWRAEFTLKDNANIMDIIALPDEQTEQRLLIMGLLSYSKNKDLARYFMTRAASSRELFTSYGF
jgi:molybdate transport system substrate-binding protein